MRYFGTAPFDHASRDLDGVLIVNLGTPAAPTSGAVRRYLAQFLSDPRVIELPRVLWWLILHGVILRIRPRRSAKAYREIWGADGSPLMVLSQALTNGVAKKLDPNGERPLAVRLAMSYGEPSIRTVLRELGAMNLRRLVVLPLYPQYSATTTASVFDAIADELKTWRRVPSLRFIADYAHDPAWTEAVAASVRHYLASHPMPDRVLLSFHGIPQRYFRNGDHYFCHCQGTAQRIAQAAGLPSERLAVTFQSRVGREPWLKPYTDLTLAAWPAQGIKRVAVLCPGFAVDCLETLEEIAMQNREAFLHAGGESFDYIPALNDSPAHIDALAGIVRSELGGWPALAADWRAADEQARLAARAQAARALEQSIDQ